MFIAFRICTINHFWCSLTAIFACGYDDWVNCINIYSHPVIEDVTFTFKILSPRLLSVLNNTSVKLIYIIKSLFQEERRRFFTFNTSLALGQYFLSLIFFMLVDLFRKLTKILIVQGDSIFKTANVMLIVRTHILYVVIIAVFHFHTLLRLEMFSGFVIRVDVGWIAESRKHNLWFIAAVHFDKRRFFYMIDFKICFCKTRVSMYSVHISFASF